MPNVAQHQHLPSLPVSSIGLGYHFPDYCLSQYSHSTAPQDPIGFLLFSALVNKCCFLKIDFKFLEYQVYGLDLFCILHNAL